MDTFLSRRPALFFLGPGVEGSRGWSTEQQNALCEHPDVEYYIVTLPIRPERYVAGQTTLEGFELLETIGPNICWDSKNPTYAFSD